MSIASLKVNASNVDDIRLVLRGELPRIIRIRDSYGVLELGQVLAFAYQQDHQGSLEVNINGETYSFEQEAWQAILSETEQWFERFVLAGTGAQVLD